jgi:hypothetical protein
VLAFASLGGAQEACELESVGVNMRYCKVWEGASGPVVWILHADKCPPPQHTIGHLRRRDGRILMRWRLNRAMLCIAVP